MKLSPWVKATMTPTKEDLTTDPTTMMMMLMAQMAILATSIAMALNHAKEVEDPTMRTMTIEVVLQLAPRDQMKS